MSNTSSRIIEVTVDPTGATTVQTKGFTGQSCRDASRFVERALGDTVSDQPTAEFYQQPTVVAPIQQQP